MSTLTGSIYIPLPHALFVSTLLSTSFVSQIFIFPNPHLVVKPKEKKIY